jgi:tRNA pseudouridine55 synthase
MYLRSLAHDLGQTLGCGAHLTRLNRLRTGHFLVEEAITFDQFETACRQDRWQALVSSPDFVVRHLKGVRVGVGLEKLLRDGQPINLGVAHMNAAYLETYRVYNTEGHFIGLIKFHRSQGVWKPDKGFKLEIPSPYAPTSQL